jgi:hypothetical protein
MKKRKRKAAVSCAECDGACCRYVATEIDRPTCKRDYDNIRWYLMHRGVTVFVDLDGDWHIEFDAVCDNLGEGNRCLRYEERPRICARHGEGDAACEFHGEVSPYRMRFVQAEEFERWLDKKGRKWRRKTTP